MGTCIRPGGAESSAWVARTFRVRRHAPRRAGGAKGPTGRTGPACALQIRIRSRLLLPGLRRFFDSFLRLRRLCHPRRQGTTSFMEEEKTQRNSDQPRRVRRFDSVLSKKNKKANSCYAMCARQTKGPLSVHWLSASMCVYLCLGLALSLRGVMGKHRVGASR